MLDCVHVDCSFFCMFELLLILFSFKKKDSLHFTYTSIADFYFLCLLRKDLNFNFTYIGVTPDAPLWYNSVYLMFEKANGFSL